MPEKMSHEWVEIQFSYDGWIECSCGYRPESQDEMDTHDKDTK